MFDAWGRFVYRRRKTILGASAIMLTLAALWGAGLFGSLRTAGGFETPSSESAHAEQLAAAALGRHVADVVAVYHSDRGSMDDPAVRSAVTGVLATLDRSRVTSATADWRGGVTADRKSVIAVLQLAGAGSQDRADGYTAIEQTLRHPPAGLTVQLGGPVATEAAVSGRVRADITKADAISFPLLFVLLIVIFGGVAAAGLPLAVGVFAILGAFAGLRMLTLFTDVSIFSVNIAMFLGLGLAIDYGLFMVSRFREQLRQGRTTEDALARTMATAGRTVAVSGITVAVSLSGLLLFEQNFLRSMGFGGIAVVVVDLIAALTILPALLALLGRRVDALPVLRRRPATGRGWYRLAHSVMRRPVTYLLATVALLVFLGLPFRHIAWGGVDARDLPAGSEPGRVTQILNDTLPRNATSPIQVVVTGVAGPQPLAEYAGRLRALPGVLGADIAGSRGRTALVTVRSAAERHSPAAMTLVQRVRATPAPGMRTQVGGVTADLADEVSSLESKLPWVALLIGLATFVLLFLAFGSIILPLKAILMNLMSLSAAFGAIVWIFQEGHLSNLLSFTVTGTIMPGMPVLVFAMIFGISMDYEVFLLSRVREEYELSGDNTKAVATGLQHTGGIISSAAVLFLAVVGAFATSGITFIKLVGVGMIIAVIVDATIVRALLVPATMRLLGAANWWAPGPLRHLYGRYGIREESDSAGSETVALTG